MLQSFHMFIQEGEREHEHFSSLHQGDKTRCKLKLDYEPNIVLCDQVHCRSLQENVCDVLHIHANLSEAVN